MQVKIPQIHLTRQGNKISRSCCIVIFLPALMLFNDASILSMKEAGTVIVSRVSSNMISLRRITCSVTRKTWQLVPKVITFKSFLIWEKYSARHPHYERKIYSLHSLFQNRNKFPQKLASIF